MSTNSPYPLRFDYQAVPSLKKSVWKIQEVYWMAFLGFVMGFGVACSKPSPVAKTATQIMGGGLAGKRMSFNLPGNVSLPVRWVPPGQFLMGSPLQEAGRLTDETQHRVQLTDGFFLGETELTQRQWSSIMKENPSKKKADDLPVENVSWEQAREFCRQLTQWHRRSGDLPDGWEWDLPFEAQWEMACRAGTTGPYSGDLETMAWFEANSGGSVQKVALKNANEWGFQDLHGNVQEWCVDWFSAYPTNETYTTNPVGPIWSFAQVVRGGSFQSPAHLCRSAARAAGVPKTVPNETLGFRPTLKKKKGQ